MDKMKNKPSNTRTFIDFAFPLRILTGVLFASIIGLTILQVFCRFLLDSPLIWSEELVRLFLVWMTFLGASVLCWDGNHLNVDTLFIRLPPKIRASVRIANRIISIVFLLILTYYSILLVQIDHMTTMSAFDIPASVVRVPATIGGALMILFILLRWLYRFPIEWNSDPDKMLQSNEPM